MRIPDRVRVILFDAVGTLIYANPSVEDAYYRAGKTHGSRVERHEIKGRFSDALANQSNVRPTSEDKERQRWRSIVADVFNDVADADALFDDLWQHFAAPEHWALFDDVALTWVRLQERRFVLGLASNFDERLLRICNSTWPLNAASCIALSSQLGHPKPSVEFFRAAERLTGAAADEILLVGDDPQNDLAGATRAGWHAVLIERHKRKGPRAIHSLLELVDGPR